MRSPLLAAATFAAAAVAGVLTGCSSFGQADDSLASIDGIAGPAERRIQQVAYEQGDLAAVTDDPDLARGQKLYDAGNYAAAEEVYRGIVKKFATDLATKIVGGGGAIGRGNERKAFDMYGSAVEEKAQFMLGESLYMQGKFTESSDALTSLVERYPSTRHLDSATRRQFLISLSWLGFDAKSFRAGGDIEQTGFASATAAASPSTAPDPPSFLNLSDKSRPTFDTVGRARQILTNIWVNDPTGPLADDSLMLLANDSYRRNDFSEAARHYEILREQYPESPHLKNAFLLEGKVRQASYDGPTYDDANLERSAQLKQRTLVEFDLDAQTRGILQRELNAIEDARAEQQWAKVELYRRRNLPTAVRLHCNAILNRHPESRYVGPAQQMLRILANEERNGGNRFALLRSVPNVPPRRSTPAPQPARLEQGIVPPASEVPKAIPVPGDDPRGLLRSRPFPRPEQYQPPERPTEPEIVPPAPETEQPERTRPKFLQASFEQTAAAETTTTGPDTADGNVQTLPTTDLDGFAEFMESK